MKRKFALVAIALSVLSAALLATLATNMQRKITQPPGAERAAYAPRTNGELPVLWQAPNFEFSAQDGKTVSKEDLKGSVWIASFIFTTCTTVCPLMTANTVLLQRRLPHSRLRFVSFSVDPEIDTVPVLAAYAKKWAKNETRWLLLRPGPDQLDELARDMRVALEATDDPNNKIMHSSMFFLVDAAGAVRGAYDSNDDRALDRLTADVDELLGKSEAAASSSTDGAELYQRLSCGACHDNQRLAPALAGLVGKNRKFKDGRTSVADRAYLERSVLTPGADIVDGYLELMPSYAPHLSQAQLAALVDHLEALASSEAAEPGASTAPDPAAEIAIDPVCSMQVRVTAETPSATHDGHEYHFCAESCRKQFVANPSKYLE